jgi:PAS domain S-box-containing protein
VSEEYRTLAESMPILVWTAAPDGALDYGNQVLADYIGAPSTEVYGTGWHKFIFPDDVERLASAWATSIATGAPLEVEYRLRRHDGVYQWFLIRALPMRDSSGAVVKWFGTCTDVDALKTAQQEATQRATFAQQLIGIVSHDLRNPVTAILLGVQSLLRLDQQDERTTRGLARVHSAAERVSRMIRDLLDFTQARLRGGIPIQRQPIDLLTIVRQSVDEVKTASPRRCINVRSSGDTTGSWDPDRIAQVITNLVTNAQQYGPPDGCVDVEVIADESHVRLCVHNEGEPIPPEQLARIFEPLERGTKSDPGIRNIGLGLFIVDHIVKAHGGRVEVRSEAGEGTTFTVTLPRA